MKIDPDMYIEAAKLVDCFSVFSCCAITDVVNSDRIGMYIPFPIEQIFYRAIMLDSDQTPLEYRCNNSKWNDEDIKQFRVLLLCMMAACCKDFKELAPR